MTDQDREDFDDGYLSETDDDIDIEGDDEDGADETDLDWHSTLPD